MLKKIALSFLALLALAHGACAETVYAKMPAHPAMWTLHGKKGTAYLFGSIHILPANVDWHTKEIDAALAKSDVMVFELAFGDKLQTDIQAYIKARGMLPEGQHLRDMLSPEARSEFDAETAQLSVPPELLDPMRPWLAALTFQVAEMQKKHYDAASGVEMSLKGAGGDKRPVIGLETLDQQLALIAPTDPKLELEAFEAGLKSSASEGTGDAMGPLLDAWMHGKTERLNTLMNKTFERYPAARKAFLDDRNAAWTVKLAQMVDEEPKTYFVAVGAAHLVGPNGVPNLLRRKGYRVDGP
jgi:uncharacterized protein YbaP (TraB family)